MAERRVLLDTGPLVALLARSDGRHQLCTETFATLETPLWTCWPVVTEAAWLLRHQHRPVDRLAEAHAAGLFEFLPLDGDDLRAIAAILRRFEPARIQLADAALVHLAGREGIRTVFTLDRRDFTILRVGRSRALRLLPEGP